MKKSYLLIQVIILLAVHYTSVYAQESIGDSAKLYNIFYLSKYITAPNLDSASQKKIYDAVRSNLGTKKMANSHLVQNHYIQRLINDVETREIIKLKEKIKSGALFDSNDYKPAVKDTATELSSRIETNLDSLKKLSSQKSGIEKRAQQGILITEEINLVSSYLQQENTIDHSQLLFSIGEQLKNYELSIIDTTAYKQALLQLDIVYDKSMYTSVPDSADLARMKVMHNVLLAIQKKLNISKEAYQEQVAAINKQIGRLEQQLKTDTDNLAKLAFANFKDDQLAFGSSLFTSSISAEQTASQINVISEVQSAQQNSLTSFRLPSESDLINAMAMFLANRTKQEAIIWFVDKLREQIHNPLLFDVFPETYKLLQQSQAYHTQTFGQAWRVSLSNDFVHMPVNLLESPWAQKMWFEADSTAVVEMKELVSIGSDLFKLLQAGYNYRDILRYFYLKKSVIIPNSQIRTSLDILYMCVNEMYTMEKHDEKANIRLLSFEEIETLNEAQWSVLLELAKAKYGPEVFNSLQQSFSDSADKVLARNKWIGSLLLTLSQLDKLTTSAVTPEISETNPTNMWRLLSEVIKQVDPKIYQESVLKTTTGNTKMFTYIDRFTSVLNIYENLHNKNFELATQATLALLHSYVIDGKIKFDINTQGELVIKSFWNSGMRVKLDKYFGHVSETLSFSINGDKLDISGHPLQSFDLKRLTTEMKPLKYAAQTFQSNEGKQWLKTIFHTDSESVKLHRYLSAHLGMNRDTTYENFLLIKLLLDLLQDPTQVSLNIAYKQFDLKNIEDLSNEKNTAQLINITSFFSDVLRSSDVTSLSAVINKHVMPPTSYILKRKSPFSITLNGYVGAFGAVQQVLSEHSQFKINTTGRSGSYGITAPIGVTLSWPTMGVFMQGVDLGNLVGHYLWQTASYSERGNVYFKEIISPGINYMYYIPKAPLVAFVGIKWIPLEETDGPGGERFNTKPLDIMQVSGGIKFDIPLIKIL